MIKHKIVTENLVKKEEDTLGVGVFRIDRTTLSNQKKGYLDSFIDNITPQEYTQVAGGDYETYLTALELSGDIEEYALLALNCRKTGLLENETSLLYPVDFKCEILFSGESHVNVKFESRSKESGLQHITIEFLLADFLALQVSREQGVLLKITDEELIFYYNTTPYFTKSEPVALSQRDVEYIKQQIASGDYSEETSLAQKTEPAYMRGITQPYLVFWGDAINAGLATTYVFQIGYKLVEVESTLEKTSLRMLNGKSPMVLLVLDEEEGAALYY